MPRHGDCKHFLPDRTNAAAEEGVCLAILDEESMPLIVNVYGDIEGCDKFEALERVRTDHSQFSWQSDVRAGRGFDEK